MVYDFRELFMRLENFGLTDALLPFLFVFVLIFALLEKVKIFNKDKEKNEADAKKVHGVIAFVVAMFVVVPHITGTYPDGWDIVEIMKTFLPGISAVIVAFLMMLLLIGLFGGSPNRAASNMRAWISVLALVIVVVIFGASAGWWRGWDWLINVLGEDAVAIIIMLLVFGIIIAYILSDSDEAKRNERFMDSWGKFFFGGGGTE